MAEQAGDQYVFPTLPPIVARYEAVRIVAFLAAADARKNLPWPIEKSMLWAERIAEGLRQTTYPQAFIDRLEVDTPEPRTLRARAAVAHAAASMTLDHTINKMLEE